MAEPYRIDSDTVFSGELLSVTVPFGATINAPFPYLYVIFNGHLFGINENAGDSEWKYIEGQLAPPDFVPAWNPIETIRQGRITNPYKGLEIFKREYYSNKETYMNQWDLVLQVRDNIVSVCIGGLGELEEFETPWRQVINSIKSL